jgi:hypothetical protein
MTYSAYGVDRFGAIARAAAPLTPEERQRAGMAPATILDEVAPFSDVRSWLAISNLCYWFVNGERLR